MGLNLEWDYDARTVTLSMPGCVERALLGFSHPFDDAKHEDSPHHWRKPNYGDYEFWLLDDELICFFFIRACY